MLESQRNELEIVKKAAFEESEISGTFRAIGLNSTGWAIVEILEMKNPEDKIDVLVTEAGKNGPGSANGMGRYEGFKIAQKVLQRGC